ncbi:Uncharacterized protein K02A2.6 [Eumeta japonica]|uniref:Uncharacterized protein K02A2.6 n=1 Tax=Eumeta variegata TaxID=151549 RepID=A0A4C1Z8J5_EUMVA|nr:Uncharacterized protein K02A2.6 [Eumeta japonica]
MASSFRDMLRMFTEFSFRESGPFAQFTGLDLVFALENIKIETAKDPLLSKIYGYVIFSRPNEPTKEAEEVYFSGKAGIHIDQEYLIWGYRVIVPLVSRRTVLNEIHDEHPGIVKMKQIARNHVWLVNRKDIERAVHGALNGLLTTWILLKIQEHRASWRTWRDGALHVHVTLEEDAAAPAPASRTPPPSTPAQLDRSTNVADPFMVASPDV